MSRSSSSFKQIISGQPFWLFLLLATLCLAADKTPKKDSGNPKKEDKSETFTFKVPVDVVVVNAVVTDKQGESGEGPESG